MGVEQMQRMMVQAIGVAKQRGKAVGCNYLFSPSITEEFGCSQERHFLPTAVKPFSRTILRMPGLSSLVVAYSVPSNDFKSASESAIASPCFLKAALVTT